jgi:hypothetical protein
MAASRVDGFTTAAAVQARRPVRMPGRAALLVLLPLALTVVPAVSQQPSFAPQMEDIEAFPAGPGREAAFYSCVACHNFKLVAQQGMSRDQWDETIDVMIKRHNMPPIDPKQRERVLDYLAAAFPPRKGPGGWQNPFAGQ